MYVGTLGRIRNMTTCFTDSIIYIAWKVPYYIHKHINDIFEYKVEILTRNGVIQNVYVTETTFNVTCPNNCIVACYEWMIRITPINLVGVGEVESTFLFLEGTISRARIKFCEITINITYLEPIAILLLGVLTW